MLDVKAGDTVIIHAYGTSSALRVQRVLPRLGVAGLQNLESPSATSPNLFVAPGTLAALETAGATAPTAATAPTSLLAISNVGNMITGADRSAEIGPQLARAVEGHQARVVSAKQTVLNDAKQAGASFTSFFQNFGYFSVLAGILLLVNIFVMLAEERKPTLGKLRAVGLRRSSLIASFLPRGMDLRTCCPNVRRRGRHRHRPARGGCRLRGSVKPVAGPAEASIYASRLPPTAFKPDSPSAL